MARKSLILRDELGWVCNQFLYPTSVGSNLIELSQVFVLQSVAKAFVWTLCPILVFQKWLRAFAICGNDLDAELPVPVTGHRESRELLVHQRQALQRKYALSLRLRCFLREVQREHGAVIAGSFPAFHYLKSCDGCSWLPKDIDIWVTSTEQMRSIEEAYKQVVDLSLIHI